MGGVAARRLAGAPAPAPVDWTAIGLGGNLGGVAAIVARFAAAVARLEALTGAAARRSRLYRSAPVGPIADQPPFVNAAIALPWQPDDPASLLAALQAIEAEHGRVRVVDQGPRTLDLDLLRIGQRRVATRVLSVPHPRLGERAFVLAPLADLGLAAPPSSSSIHLIAETW